LTSTKSTPKKKRFLELYEKNGCNISATCKAVGINRTTFYNWKSKSKKFSKQIHEIQEGLIDYAESKLIQKVRDGDVTCLIFFLKTKGKMRGYSEKYDLNHSGEINANSQLTVNVVHTKKPEEAKD